MDLCWKKFSLLLCSGFVGLVLSCEEPKEKSIKTIENSKKVISQEFIHIPTDSQVIELQVINRTFLGNEQRNGYGQGVPQKWDLLWKHYLGVGKTRVKKGQEAQWAGAGWTGQPLLFKENGKLFLLQGAYDHHLKKIDAHTGKLVWEVPFEDVIKGTGTIYLNHHTQVPELRAIVLQGSRQSYQRSHQNAPALKAISLLTGKVVWELNVERTQSYSRDADASALILNDTAYIGLENGLFVSFLPDPRKAHHKNGLLQPKILKRIKFFRSTDALKHAGNLVIEASPAALGHQVFVCAGSGHVIAYDTYRKKVVWDYYIGSDLDGTPVVSKDSCVLVAVEKQYIKGNGGILKLNPRTKQVEWFFPTQNKLFADWKGGVIGSPAVHDTLVATNAIDGNLYVFHLTAADTFTKLPDNKTLVRKPKLLFRYPIGPSISTPLWIDDYLITAGYQGIYIFQKDPKQFLRLVKKIEGRFEASPFVYEKKLYIASRDGYLYCYGER